MKFVKQSAQLIRQNPGLDGIYSIIESAGRTCYKSDIGTGPDHAKKFTSRMIESKHMAMLEHAVVYLVVSNDDMKVIDFYNKNHFSYVNYSKTAKAYCITTNYRVIVENDRFEDLDKYMVDRPFAAHEKWMTVRVHMDRVGSQSVVRHRVMSFAQESTRYCLYLKEKFGSELKIVVPQKLKDVRLRDAESIAADVVDQMLGEVPLWKRILTAFKRPKKLDAETLWAVANKTSESVYMRLCDEYGWKAQEARSVLPFDVDTEIVISGPMCGWKHFFDLRSHGTTGAPHPDIKILSDQIEKIASAEFLL